MRELVVVTGGGGYIGAHLTRQLLAQGMRVRVLDSFLYGTRGIEDLVDHGDLEVVKGDICDAAVVARATRDADSVIALAALVGDAACDLRPEWSVRVNYEATRLLLAACEESKVRRLVFASSCSVYGANGAVWLTEGSTLNPVSLYARTRLMSEDLLLAQTRRVEVVVLRMATVCGVSPRMRFDLMVNTMAGHAMAHGVVRVSGAGQWRPHVHVQDAAEAFILAMNAPLRRERVFNVGADAQNFTIGDVAQMVVAGIPGVRLEQLSSNGDPRSYRVSFERIRDYLGFQPRRTVEDAIKEVRSLLTNGSLTYFGDPRCNNLRWLSDSPGHEGAV